MFVCRVVRKLVKQLGKTIRCLFATTVLFFMLMFQIVSIMALPLPQSSLNGEDVSKADNIVSEARKKVYEAYAAVVDTEASGGNVTGLVERINEAIDLVRKAENISDTDPEQAAVLAERAINIANEVLDEAGVVKEEGLALKRFQLFLEISSGILFVFSGFLVYFYGPRVFWRIWVKIKGDWRVRSGGKRRPRKGWLVDEEVLAVVLAILVVVCVFAVAQVFFAGRVVEPFSELGILGPYMKIGDYPREVRVGEKFKLYVYVGNHMGRVMYYIVYIKLGNQSVPLNFTYPYPAPVIARFERILMHNESWIFPIYLVMNKTGINYRIVFELWIYNETIACEQFHQRTCQLWLNVTEV